MSGSRFSKKKKLDLDITEIKKALVQSGHNVSDKELYGKIKRVDRGWGSADAVGWGVLGHHGNTERDSGAQVKNRGALPPKGNLIRNEKGLWVKADRNEAQHSAEKLVQDTGRSVTSSHSKDRYVKKYIRRSDGEPCNKAAPVPCNNERSRSRSSSCSPASSRSADNRRYSGPGRSLAHSKYAYEKRRTEILGANNTREARNESSRGLKHRKRNRSPHPRCYK